MISPSRLNDALRGNRRALKKDPLAALYVIPDGVVKYAGRWYDLEQSDDVDAFRRARAAVAAVDRRGSLLRMDP